MPEPVDTSSAASGRWAAISNAEYLRKWLGLGIAIGTRRRLKTDPVSTQILTPSTDSRLGPRGERSCCQWTIG
jgi:hypothetical protein